jgi:hypothetical protein
MAGETARPRYQENIGDCRRVREGSRDRGPAFPMRARSASDAAGRNPFVHNVKYHASAWRATDGARPLAARRRVTLHDHRAAFDHGEGFAEAFDARANALGGAEVEDHDMVLRVVDDLA